MKPNQRLWWTSRCSTDLWYEEAPGSCSSMYFPKAQWLLQYFPWVAVRLFWIQILFNDGLNMYWGQPRKLKET